MEAFLQHTVLYSYSANSAHKAEPGISCLNHKSLSQVSLQGEESSKNEEPLQHFIKLISAAKGFLHSNTKKAFASNKKFTANEQSLVSCIFHTITGSEKASVQVAVKQGLTTSTQTEQKPFT